MRYALILAVAALLISSPLGGFAQQIYWNPGEQQDATITDKDFIVSFAEPEKPKSLAEREVYDTGEIDTSDMDEGSAAVAPLPEPRSRRESPALRETPRPTRSRLPRSLKQEQSTERGSKASVRQQKRRGTPVPAVAGREDKAEAKKMEWGKVEVKTVEPKNKLQWGRQQ
ncbi:MAG: hypothetical protein P8182_11440 [Deltaproteobacteria bacterium]